MGPGQRNQTPVMLFNKAFHFNRKATKYSCSLQPAVFETLRSMDHFWDVYEKHPLKSKFALSMLKFIVHMPSGKRKCRGLANQNSLKAPALDWAGKHRFGRDLLSLSALFQQPKHWLSYIIFLLLFLSCTRMHSNHTEVYRNPQQCLIKNY